MKFSILLSLIICAFSMSNKAVAADDVHYEVVITLYQGTKGKKSTTKRRAKLYYASQIAQFCSEAVVSRTQIHSARVTYIETVDGESGTQTTKRLKNPMFGADRNIGEVCKFVVEEAYALGIQDDNDNPDEQYLLIYANEKNHFVAYNETETGRGFTDVCFTVLGELPADKSKEEHDFEVWDITSFSGIGTMETEFSRSTKTLGVSLTTYKDAHQVCSIIAKKELGFAVD